MLHWRLYLEEYSSQIEHIDGNKNCIADTLSCLDRKESVQTIFGPKCSPNQDIKKRVNGTIIKDSYYSIFEDPEMVECFLAIEDTSCLDLIKDNDCFLNFPEIEIEQIPLNIENIKEAQDEEERLQWLKSNYPQSYYYRKIGDVQNVLCYTKPGRNPNENWKIVLPKVLLKTAIKWFHEITGHPGSKRLLATMTARYYHEDMRSMIDKFVCEYCQKHKLPGKYYCLLPER